VAGAFNNKGKSNGATDTVTGTQLSVAGSATVATQTGDITLTGANVVAEGSLIIHAVRDLTIMDAYQSITKDSSPSTVGKTISQGEGVADSVAAATTAVVMQFGAPCERQSAAGGRCSGPPSQISAATTCAIPGPAG
jgi:hypothetical protein